MSVTEASRQEGKRKLRIAVWHNLPSGGAKRALYDHVRGLVARGHTVEAWCPPTADRTYLPLTDLIHEHVVPTSPQPVAARRNLFERVTHRPLECGMIEEVTAYSRLSADEINRGGFDLLFANTCMSVAASPIGRFVNIPKVIYLQEPSRWLYEAVGRSPWSALASPNGSWWKPANLKDILRDNNRVRGLRIQVREEWQNAKAYDAILVNSYYSRESVLRAYGLDARVCYLGIDAGKFAARGLARESFVLGVGGIAPHKNIKLVIQSLARVRHPRPRLVWVGNEVSTVYLREMKEIAAANEVEFEPLVRISDNMLVDLLNRAAMMVYVPRLEPFGFAPLEANACGVPVVAVAEGGVRETIVDGINGLLVEHDPQAMADAITRLIADTSYARQLGATGYRLIAEKWSMNSAVDRLEQRFLETLNSKTLDADD